MGTRGEDFYNIFFPALSDTKRELSVKVGEKDVGLRANLACSWPSMFVRAEGTSWPRTQS